MVVSAMGIVILYIFPVFHVLAFLQNLVDQGRPQDDQPTLNPCC